MPDVKGNAEGTSRVARGGLHPNVREESLLEQAPVRNGIQGHAARHAEARLGRFLPAPRRDLDQPLLERLLTACGDVLIPLRVDVFFAGTWRPERVDEAMRVAGA